MKKYLILISAVCVNLCLGSVYAWSVFVPKLTQQYQYTTTQTQIVFGTVIMLLTVTMLFTGKLENRLGPRIMILISSLLLFTGYMIASFAKTNFLILWAGYGLTTGLGIGFGYITVLAVCLRWFKQKGLIAGVVVSGYGLGAIILSFFAQRLLDADWDVMKIFRLTAVAYGMVTFLCALVMSNPAHFQTKKLLCSIDIPKLLRKPRFIILALTTGLGTFPGLMIIGNLKPIALSLGYSTSFAVIAISVLSLSNAAGRILAGGAHDRLKAYAVMAVLFSVFLSVLLLAFAGSISTGIFLLLISYAAMSYGGIIANIPAQVADEFGHDNFGTIYPIVLLVHGITALFAAPIGGYFFDLTGSYKPAMIIAAAIAFACLITFFLAYRKVTA
jgi:OFA family oxalate/formate antiporter-like MFS transporter